MPTDRDEELAKEIRAHLELEIEERLAAGASADDARDAALRAFGNVARVREDVREVWTVVWWDDLKQDIRYGVRTLTRSPGFVATALLTLALGIGANTAIFQLVDAVRLRSLPIRNAKELAIVELADLTAWRGRRTSGYPVLSNPLWEEFRAHQDVFSGVLAWSNTSLRLNQAFDSQSARGIFVSGEFFEVLGVPPALGRVFDASDDRRACRPPAIVSHAFWQRELGGDGGAIGRTLMIDSTPIEVVGVTPASFTGLEVGRSFDIALPICAVERLGAETGWLEDGSVSWLTVMGRLKGRSLDVASARLAALSPALFEATLPRGGSSAEIDGLRLELKASPGEGGVSALRTRYGAALMILLAMTGLVLFVACTNLANLLLARASTRDREFAVRLALGASRMRIVRQLMVENGILAIVGAAAGLLVAALLNRLLLRFLGAGLSLDFPADRRLLAFVTVVAAATCLTFGLVPAWRASRAGAIDAIKASGRSLSASRQVLRFRQALPVSQVAVSLVLLFGALLFSSTLRNLFAVDPGFRTEGIHALRIDFSRLENTPGAPVTIRRDALDRIRSVPGVTAAAEVRHVPFSGTGSSVRVWRDDAGPASAMTVRLNAMSDGFLDTMGIALVAGRDLSRQDSATSPRVAIVNHTFARRLRLAGELVGQRFRGEGPPGAPEQLFEIIGVVGDTKYFTLREDSLPIVFVPLSQISDPRRVADFVMRLDSPSVRHFVIEALSRLSPRVSFETRALEATIRDGLLRERLLATLSGFIGALAILMAGVGLYGVISYLVTRRRNEIGVRMALGASRLDILAMVLRQAGVLLGMGLVLGSALSIAAGRLTRSLIFGVEPDDLRAIGLACAVLATVALVASFLPARRASCIAPVTALRDD